MCRRGGSTSHKISLNNKIGWCNLLLFIGSLLLIVNLLFNPSSARYGYDLHVIVNDSTTGEQKEWRRSFSTNGPLTFTSESKSSGNGNFSKYNLVSNFGGMGFKETTYGKKGRLAESNKLKVVSEPGIITIKGEVYNLSYKEDFDLKYQDYAIVEVNESAPNFVYNEGQIVYSGEGIHALNSYESSSERIKTDYYSTFLNKKSIFGGIFRGSYALAKITPRSVNEIATVNKSLAFGLSSVSEGKSSFNVRSSVKEIGMDEVYIGSFNIDRKIFIDWNATINDLEQIRDMDKWLDCCIDLNETAKLIRELDTSDVFDPKSQA